jgi:beta-mannanase
MEIPILRYPWQSQDPVLYIQAFRHFMELASQNIHAVIKVWGPAGDRGSLEWWPGDKYVDMISIAIYGLPDKNITDPLKQESFETIYNRKIRRMRFVNKPIFITEFGVKGPEEYQNLWLEGAANVIREHPEIMGVNYFNMVDNPEVWGEGMKPPDWSITQESFELFIAVLDR